MDRSFLEEYEEREFLKANISINARIGKLNPPLFWGSGLDASMWSQIAFAGTTIIPITPIPEAAQISFKNCDLRKELTDLVSYVKETKKVQFVLCGMPTDFQDCHHLEPIFEELSPPVFFRIFPENLNKIHNEYCIELSEAAKISSGWTKLNPQIITTFSINYAHLRELGYHEIADLVIDNIVINPTLSARILYMADQLILPLAEQFNANRYVDIESLRIANHIGLDAQLPEDTLAFPEIGSFLMGKLTKNPNSLRGCINLIDHYEDYDLYKIFSALSDAVNQTDSSSVIRNAQEMGTILENVWNDTKVSEDAKFYEGSIYSTLGAIGFFLNPSIGLLGSLGVPVLKTKIKEASETWAKKVAPPNIAAIYDFKKNYQGVMPR